MRKFFTHTDPVVPMHHPSALVDEAVAQGADRLALLNGTDITPAMLSSAEARIAYRQFARLIRNALFLTNNPALGIDLGRRLQVSHLGVLGLLLMSSPSAGAAITGGLKYYRALAPAWDLKLRVEGDRAVLSAREVISLEPFRAFASEALLAALEGLCRHLFGAIVIHELRLHYPEPSYVARYQELFAGSIHFEQIAMEATFDAALLGRPLLGADAATANWAERQCAAQLSSVVSGEGLVEEVRRLMNATPGAYPDLSALAHRLQTSARSLRRSLKEVRTSYQELLDEARRAHAIQYVSSSGMTCELIAAKLGFSDARSFRRAFKRWTGTAPNDFRAEESA